ncbi:MAG: ATP-binding protein [Gallionella sp.]|nr:ATP-binding protein [Gallionella sp.]
MFSNATTHFRNLATSTSSFVRWVATGVALLNLFVFGMVAFSLYQSYGEVVENVEVTAQNLAQILAQDIGADIGKVDLALLATADEIELQYASGGIKAHALNTFMARMQGRVPEVFSLRMSDTQGNVRYGTGVNPDARVTNFDREYFIRQRINPNAGLVIGQPIFTRIDQRWAIPLSRAIHLPDGSFGGVVYANLSIDRLTNIFAKLNVGPRGSISLRDAELRIFARYPVPGDIPRVLGEKLAVPELQEMIGAGRVSGAYVTSHTLDGIERKFAVRKISGYSLYAVIGRATDEYMARWKDQAVKTSILAVLFFLTTLISSWLLYRSWKYQLAATLELAREEEKFHTVADYTYDWEYWEGAGREILFMSPSCERLTGYSQSEFMSDPELLYRIIHPDDRHLMEAHRIDAAHEDEAGADFRIVRRNGEIRWIAHGCCSVYGRDGTFNGRRACNRDITERKQAEAEVLTLNAELEQRVAQRTAQLEANNKELEEFSYSMSHDMRTPLRALDGFSKILLEEHAAGLDDEGKRMLKVLRDNARRMGRLVDDILLFLSMGRRKIAYVAVDVAKLVPEIFAELQAVTPARRLRLVLGTLPPAWGDRDMIREVLQHLLSNAVKFSPNDGEVLIEVGCTNEEEGNCYYVKDRGVGFDMRYADKLFKVFERVHPTGQFEGSGIGLAIVKRIVTRHGGRVWAEGKVNGGATIYFALPAKDESAISSGNQLHERPLQGDANDKN